METWAHWVFAVMCLSAALKTIVIGFCTYPRTSSRGADSIDLILGIGLLLWGACAIW